MAIQRKSKSMKSASARSGIRRKETAAPSRGRRSGRRPGTRQEMYLLEHKPGPSVWVDPKLDARRAPNRDASTSGLVSKVRDKIVERHFREHPEGDPAVRRIRPDRGTIPVETRIAPGIMRVFTRKTRGRKKRAA